jgi:hypothetical protein
VQTGQSPRFQRATISLPLGWRLGEGRSKCADGRDGIGRIGSRSGITYLMKTKATITLEEMVLDAVDKAAGKRGRSRVYVASSFFDASRLMHDSIQDRRYRVRADECGMGNPAIMGSEISPANMGQSPPTRSRSRHLPMRHAPRILVTANIDMFSLCVQKSEIL